MASLAAGARSVSRRFSPRLWPTGVKLLLVISAALLPLAIIAIFATLQTTRIANVENMSRLRLASGESARALAIEVVGDMTALRVAMNALAKDPADAASCARVQGVFAQQATIGGRFVITDAGHRPICGERFPHAHAPVVSPSASTIDAAVLPGQGLVLSIQAAGRQTAASAFFPVRFLADISKPSGFTSPYGTTLIHGSQRLALRTLDRNGTLDRRDTRSAALGVGGLTLEMQVHSAPISSPLIIALLLPLLMWAAAAAIAWFVVDRLLIWPLRRLRASVATFVPGEVIDPGEVHALPAQEIRELGETFRTISRMVALHEAGLAEGLQRQTRLTREVHHRVKNNLQVISSLINIHARGSKGAEASNAYASIQRRVDALAVVHRNHFAEAEENRGLNLRAVIGELASNIRATAPEDSARLGIVLDVDSFLVNQDVAVAVAFLVTEMIELAITCDPAPQIRIVVKADETPDRAILTLTTPALADSEARQAALKLRYGRVLEGLSRQLRARLHYDPAGLYEIPIAVLGRD